MARLLDVLEYGVQEILLAMVHAVDDAVSQIDFAEVLNSLVVALVSEQKVLQVLVHHKESNFFWPEHVLNQVQLHHYRVKGSLLPQNGG